MSEALQDYRITIEEFRAFIEDRPDSEKWELIDGETVLNPAPNTGHQIVVPTCCSSLRRSGGVQTCDGTRFLGSAFAIQATAIMNLFRTS